MLKKYVGVKLVEAKPMTRKEYDDSRGVLINDYPADEDGYEVVYPDGYVSWCPKKQFEEANRPVDGLTFGHAIEMAKMGCKITRNGWNGNNGKNAFVVYMPPLNLPPFNTQGTYRKVNDRTAKFIGEDKPLNCQPYFAMYNAQEEWIPGWLASQSDMLAEDWRIIDEY